MRVIYKPPHPLPLHPWPPVPLHPWPPVPLFFSGGKIACIICVSFHPFYLILLLGEFLRIAKGRAQIHGVLLTIKGVIGELK